jgi:hypothetical protein
MSYDGIRVGDTSVPGFNSPGLTDFCRDSSGPYGGLLTIAPVSLPSGTNRETTLLRRGSALTALRGRPILFEVSPLVRSYHAPRGLCLSTRYIR